MDDKRFKLGLCITGIWMLVIASLLYFQKGHLAELTPNAWGDFFAGAFAPLAFLWLVLGYLQQGEELRHSTDALRLQAEELKNSVEQQRALVEVSRQQIEREMQAAEEERRARDEEVRPIFKIAQGVGIFHQDGQSNYGLEISNVGGIASSVIVDMFHLDEAPTTLGAIELLKEGQTWKTRAEFRQPQFIDDTILRIRFKYCYGRPGELRYVIMRLSQDPQSAILVQPVVI
jgi:hypothetical protein